MDLDSLQPTQESLWAAATQAMASVQPQDLQAQWNDCFARSSPSHRLTLLYLANEICQRCKRTHPEFLQCFGALLPSAFAALARQRPDFVDKLLRILQVWEERAVMSRSELDKIRSVVVDVDSSKRVKTAVNDSPEYTVSPPSAGAGLTAEQEQEQVQEETPTTHKEQEDSYLMEIVALAKTLEVPKEHAELFEQISQAESDSVKFELDQENQDRLALKVYKIAKTKRQAATDDNDNVNALLEFAFAVKFDQEERQAREETQMDVYEQVETLETVQVDAKQARESCVKRQQELELQLDRDQHILLGLSDILETKFRDRADPVSAAMSEEERLKELELLSNQLSICDGWIARVTSRLDAEKRATREEQERTRQEAEKQLEESVIVDHAEPAAAPTRQRRPRWGDAVTEPQAMIDTRGWGPPIGVANQQQQPQPLATWQQQPPPPWPQQQDPYMQQQQQYAPPPTWFASPPQQAAANNHHHPYHQYQYPPQY